MSKFERPFKVMGRRYVYGFNDLRRIGDETVYHSENGITELELRMFQSAASSYGVKHNVYVRTGRIDSNTISATHGGVRPTELPEDRKARLAEKRAKFPGWGLHRVKPI